MKRRLLNFATLLSLLLCAGFTAVWARSACRSDVFRGTFGRSTPRTFLEIKSEAAAVSVTYMPTCPYGAYRERHSDVSRPRWFGDGFLWYRYRDLRNPLRGSPAVDLTYYRVQAPSWAMVAATLVLPACRGASVAWLRRKKRLARAGRCRQCGYDLRGSPERCPAIDASVA